MRPKKFTDSELEALVKAGLTKQQIADNLGVAFSSVVRRLKAAGLAATPGKGGRRHRLKPEPGTDVATAFAALLGIGGP